MAKNSKKNNGLFLGAVIGALSLALIAATVYWSTRDTVKVEPELFNLDKKNMAEKYYSRIMDTDLVSNYPDTPEGVMDFYNDTFFMIYSNMIINDGTILEILSRQREVYSAELLALNDSLQLQFSNLKDALDTLLADKNICLSVERKGTVYDEENPKNCRVQVIIRYNTFGALYRNYYLINDPEDNRWKVYTWEMTDENFRASAY